MGSHDPYSASKGAAELVVSSYRNSFFSPSQLASHGKKVASVRAGNVIGGGDWARDRLIPDLVRAFAAGQPAVLRNPRSTRPWQHVLDALHGYLTLGVRMLREDGPWLCDGWNFGPDDGSDWPVDRVAAAFCDTWKGCSVQIAPQAGAVHEAHVLRLDSTKSRLMLGWQPRWETREAVQRTASWYQRHYAKDGGGAQLCLEDLKAFSAKGV